MFDVAGSVGVIDKLVKVGRYFFRLYKNKPSNYLGGSLSDGLEVSNRIIALFEAHHVRRTQIYHILGEMFPVILPGINAQTLNISMVNCSKP